MAIAFDNASSADTGGGTSVTLSHTVNSNTNGLLIVSVMLGTGISNDITSVTYNGDAMTFHEFANASTTAFAAVCAVYYLFTPDTGTHDVAVTTTANAINYVLASSYTGVKQSGFPDAVGTGSPAGSAVGQADLSVSITSVADNSWGLLIGDANVSGGITAGTNTLVRTSQDGGRDVISDTNAAQTPAGAFSMNWTFATAKFNAVYFSIAPALAGPANLKTYNTNVKSNVKRINTNVIANVKSLDTNV